jgi:SAM-dependent methyltransferase
MYDIANHLKFVFSKHSVQLYQKLRCTLLTRFFSSTNYRIITPDNKVIEQGLRDAWKNQNIPDAQRHIVNEELKRMYKGDILPIYQILADAVKMTGCEYGQIVEVGCASGYYSEVLHYLLGHPIKYIGVDYSPALIKLARQYYPDTFFLLGDATNLPFKTKMLNVLISGCVLLHVSNYEQAITESARVSRRWIIFHRTPVVHGPTVHYTKLAYGVRCLEIAFGEEELLDLFRKSGLTVVKTFEISKNMIPCTSYQGYGVTFLCRVN